MRYSARKLGVLAAGLIIVGLIVYAAMPAAVPVDLAPAVRGPLRVTVDEDGKTRIKERYVVSTPLTGRLQRIELHPGDPVRANETILAVLEPREPELLDARAVAQAEARVRAAETAQQRATPALERARAAHDLAEKNYARVRRVRERGASSPQELDEAEQDLRSSSEQVRSDQFAMQIADYELELARAALIRTRPDGKASQDDRFAIRSPITGRVLRVFQESATAITAGTRLIEVGDPANLECEFDVLSTDAVKIRPGARVILDHWGGDVPLEGRVRVIEPAAFTKVSALGVEEQRVYVVVDFEDSPEAHITLGDAYRVEGRIVIWENERVLKVPVGALFRQGDAWAVFVAENGRARMRTIQVGHSSGLEAEVQKGLSEGDRVVVHPSDRVQDGVAIEPRSG